MRLMTMEEIKNNPVTRALYEKLNDKDREMIDRGMENPREMHLEAITVSLKMLGASTWLAMTAVISTILGYEMTHFKQPEDFIEYLDKALNEEELGRLASALLMITEAKQNETTRKFR